MRLGGGGMPHVGHTIVLRHACCGHGDMQLYSMAS